MHRTTFCLAALLLGALASVPGEVAGQSKKNQQPKAQAATSQDYYLIQNQKSLTGMLLSFDDASHTVSVRIDFPEWVPNPKYRPNAGAQHSLVSDYNRLMQEQQRMASSRNAQQMQQHYNNMMNLQNRIAADMMRMANINPNNLPFMKKDHLKDFDFDMEEKVVYRKMFLPEEYDDTGNLKKLSKEEIKKLRGDNKPKDSYSATPEEFHPGQGIWVYLKPPPKDGASSSSSSSASAKKDEKDKSADATDDSVPHPTVRMLVIHHDGSLPSNTQTKKKQKN